MGDSYVLDRFEIEECSDRRDGEVCFTSICEAAIELEPPPDGCEITRHWHGRADEINDWVWGTIYTADETRELHFCSVLCRDVLLTMAMDFAKSEGVKARADPEPAMG